MAIEQATLTEAEQSQRRLGAKISLIVSVVLLSAKFWAFAQTHSQAVFSDAVESIVNVVAAALAMVVVSVSAKPADKEHPYGHGKAEYFSSAFEGGLIAFAAFWIVVEAVRGFLEPSALRQLDFGVAVVLAAGFANLFLGLYLLRLGRLRSSIALRASGHHVISDFWTSMAVAIGLFLVRWTGWLWMDSLIAVIMGLVLARSGYLLVRESIRGLMDEEDLSVLGDLASVFAKESLIGIIQIHHVKVIRSGWYHHIDAHLVLPEFWTVEQVHDHVNVFEQRVIKRYPYGGEMNFHFDPCRRAYCRVCDLEPCSIRAEKFEKKIPVLLEHMRSTVEPAEFR